MSYFTPPKIADHPPRTSAHDFSLDSVRKPGARTDKQMAERASSIGDWMRSKLPSRRPERGGTRRDQGYWEQLDRGDKPLSYPRRRATDNHRNRRSDTGDSDLITKWNTAKDLPKPSRGPTTAGIPRRAVSSAKPKRAFSNDDQRRVSWLSPADGKVQLSMLPVQPATASGSEIERNFRLGAIDGAKVPEAPPETLAADRRLSLARKAIEEKKELRRRRQELKESGDYLGVQGINPDTGQLDVITPTDSGRSSASQETTQKINAIRQALRGAKSNYKEAAQQSEREIQKIILDKERQKMKKIQKEKDEIQRLNQALLKWRRHTRQWSSAQEPDLSPIAQSHKSGASTSSR